FSLQYRRNNKTNRSINHSKEIQEAREVQPTRLLQGCLVNVGHSPGQSFTAHCWSLCSGPPEDPGQVCTSLNTPCLRFKVSSLRVQRFLSLARFYIM
ncbi:hypothetical protein LEMLEM_LOCUS6651, partial [Lemmus lemmus]